MPDTCKAILISWLHTRHAKSGTSASTAAMFTWYNKTLLNTLRPRQNGHHFVDDIFHQTAVTMSTMASQIPGISIVYSTVYSGVHQKISKLRITGLCNENPPVTRGFPSQRTSKAENVPMWVRHHANAFLRRHMHFYKYFTEICSRRSNWRYSNIGSDNGLAPYKQYAIIWTHGG